MNSEQIFDIEDNELADFFRALALPIRSAIVRRIILYKNNVIKEVLFELPYKPEVINKHLTQLRTLKIIKVAGSKNEIIYSVDPALFKRISKLFSSLATNIEGNKEQTKSNVLEEKLKQSLERRYFTNFGEYIKFRRLELNISQEKLCEKVGIDRSNFSKVESGKKNFDINKLMLLSKALYINLSTLKKEYFSYQIKEIAEGSGLIDTILDSVREKIDHFNNIS
jgi:transcriptional regulator with XRE-family HTH domain